MVQSDSGRVDLRRVLYGMGLRASRIRRIAHRRNTHWIVDTPGQRVVLRRYASDRSHGDVAKVRWSSEVDGGRAVVAVEAQWGQGTASSSPQQRSGPRWQRQADRTGP